MKTNCLALYKHIIMMRNSMVTIAIYLLAISTARGQRSPAKYGQERELNSSGVLVPTVLSAKEQENLCVLAKTWGFLKYYHPDVAKGNYSFDSCLFSILPRVLKAEDRLKRNDLLLNWINTLGDETKYVEIN